MQSFLNAYIEAALWSSTDDEGDPMDRKYCEGDIHGDTLALMSADCAAFQAANAEFLARTINGEYGADAINGHNFWLSRNGHGAGFFCPDSVPDDCKEPLQKAARKCDEFNLYVGDDGKIHGHKG